MGDFVQLKDGESIMKVARANNKWLGVIDIVDHVPFELTIKCIGTFKDEPFEKGRKESGMALQFVGTPKMLILNAGHLTALHQMFGNDPRDLKGKKITLTVEKLAHEFMNRTHGIRIQRENDVTDGSDSRG